VRPIAPPGDGWGINRDRTFLVRSDEVALRLPPLPRRKKPRIGGGAESTTHKKKTKFLSMSTPGSAKNVSETGAQGPARMPRTHLRSFFSPTREALIVLSPLANIKSFSPQKTLRAPTTLCSLLFFSLLPFLLPFCPWGLSSRGV